MRKNKVFVSGCFDMVHSGHVLIRSIDVECLDVCFQRGEFLES